MQSSTSDLHSLAARVERLEKQYDSLKSDIETEKLVLTDSDGGTRATLCMSDGGPGLDLYDTNGKKRAFLRVSAEGPSLHLFDANGGKRLTLNVDEVGPNLALFNANGNPDVAVVTLDDGPSVNLSDPANADGNTCVRLQVDSNGPVLVSVKNGKMLWSAP
jgi:hypothetical protein